MENGVFLELQNYLQRYIDLCTRLKIVCDEESLTQLIPEIEYENKIKKLYSLIQEGKQEMENCPLSIKKVIESKLQQLEKKISLMRVEYDVLLAMNPPHEIGQVSINDYSLKKVLNKAKKDGIS